MSIRGTSAELDTGKTDSDQGPFFHQGDDKPKCVQGMRDLFTTVTKRNHGRTCGGDFGELLVQQKSRPHDTEDGQEHAESVRRVMEAILAALYAERRIPILG